MQTAHLFYRVDRRQINYVRFIFEAYEGLAVVTTLDVAKGNIVLAVAPGCLATARAIMEDLGSHFKVEPLVQASATAIY
jgi:hypothetical protein